MTYRAHVEGRRTWRQFRAQCRYDEQLALWRSRWPKGPWDEEPDQLEWRTLAGYPGWICRNAVLGSLNGYVAVPKGHPLFGVLYGDLDCGLGAWHGCTFSEPTAPCRPVPVDEPELWWFGFDTGHYTDLAPAAGVTKDGLRELLSSIGARYRDLEFVRSHVEALAANLRALDTRVS